MEPDTLPDWIESEFEFPLERSTVVERAVEDAFVDQLGHECSGDGEALTGPKAGERLDQLGANGCFRFAWSDFIPTHPSTTRQTPG